MSCFVPLDVSVPQIGSHCSKGLLKNYVKLLTLNLLTTTIVAPPSNASKWQMGFNSAFKGLIHTFKYYCCTVYSYLINYFRAY
jgi:hypothetical protein